MKVQNDYPDLWDKAPSLFLSEPWTRIEVEALGAKPMWFIDGDSVAKVSVSGSRWPLIKKNLIGGEWDPATGVGIVGDARQLYLQLRGKLNGAIVGMAGQPLKVSGLKVTENSIRIIDISKPQNSIFGQFAKNRRRGITKAQKMGVVVKEETDPEKAAAVIEKIKSEYPSYQKKNMRGVLEIGMKLGVASVFVAYVDGAPAAESLFLMWNRRMLYATSGTAEKYRPYNPADVMIWKAILWGKKNGMKEFSMVGGVCDKSGIDKYKSAFGGEGIERRYVFRQAKLGPLFIRI